MTAIKNPTEEQKLILDLAEGIFEEQDKNPPEPHPPSETKRWKEKTNFPVGMDEDALREGTE